MNLPTPPAFPNQPPQPFLDQLGAHPVRYWRRIALAIWLLASTGYALQLELAEAMAQYLGLKSSQCGSLKRLFKLTLADQHHLVEYSQPIRLVYQEEDVLFQLTEKGQQLARLLGCAPVPSEWQTFREKHNGDRERRHMVAALKFAYYFRRRGCQVEVLPHVSGRLRPDLLAITPDGARYYLEVETEPRSDPDKWYAIQKKFELVRFCLLTDEAEESLARKLDALDPPVEYTITTLGFMAHNQNPYYYFSRGS